MAVAQPPGWDKMNGVGAPIGFEQPETKREVESSVDDSDQDLELTRRQLYLYGYWVFANDEEQLKAFQFGIDTAEYAVQAYLKLNGYAGDLLVTWKPGHLDGAQGIGIDTIRNHVEAIDNRRFRLGDHFPTLTKCPEYGYRGTDPLWYMRKGANTQYITSIQKLTKYTLPTEQEIVEAWGDDWYSLAGEYNQQHPPSKFYLAASNRKISRINTQRRYGPVEEKTEFGPAEYARPRPHGTDLNDVTSFHPGQWDWDMTNLPAILYQLKATDADNNPMQWPLPPQLRDADGNPVYDPADSTFPVLDFPFLPFSISTKEDPSQLAAWLRLDPRLTWHDITARMIATGRPQYNALNMRLSRFSVAVGIFRWRDSNKSSNKIQAEVQNGTRLPLTAFEVRYNTTRGRTPGWNYSDDEDVPATTVQFIPFGNRLSQLNSVVDSVAHLGAPRGPQGLTLVRYSQQLAADNALRSTQAPISDYPDGNNIRRGRPRKSKVPRPGEEDEIAVDDQNTIAQNTTAQSITIQNTIAQNIIAQNTFTQTGFAQHGLAQHGLAQNGLAQNGSGLNAYAQYWHAQNAYPQNSDAQPANPTRKRKRAINDYDDDALQEPAKRVSDYLMPFVPFQTRMQNWANDAEDQENEIESGGRPDNLAPLIPFQTRMQNWVDDVKAQANYIQGNMNENEMTYPSLAQPIIPFPLFKLPDVSPGEDMFGRDWVWTDYSQMDAAAAEEELEKQAMENLFNEFVTDEWNDVVDGLNQ